MSDPALEVAVRVESIHITSGCSVEKRNNNDGTEGLYAIRLVTTGNCRIGKLPRCGQLLKRSGVVSFYAAIVVSGIIRRRMGGGVGCDGQSGVRRSGTRVIHHDCRVTHMALIAS